MAMTRVPPLEAAELGDAVEELPHAAALTARIATPASRLEYWGKRFTQSTLRLCQPY
jgi:hypothetical protein